MFEGPRSFELVERSIQLVAGSWSVDSTRKPNAAAGQESKRSPPARPMVSFGGVTSPSLVTKMSRSGLRRERPESFNLEEDGSALGTRQNKDARGRGADIGSKESQPDIGPGEARIQVDPL